MKNKLNFPAEPVFFIFLFFATIVLLFSCQQPSGSSAKAAVQGKDTAHCINPASRASLLAHSGAGDSLHPAGNPGKTFSFIADTSKWPAKPWPLGMVWIPGGEYTMGGVGDEARADEFPLHKVRVDGFWMDATEVTIGAFKKFVKATGYITEAEKNPDWNQLKQQLPPGTPQPPAAALVAGALVFTPTDGPVPLNDFTQWWRYVPGADWKHPYGPKSDVFNTTSYDNHPVSGVCWFDAVAYCKWSGKRLPTEAEWEFASRGGLEGKAYSWGDEKPSATNIKANLWQGGFPYDNKQTDGFMYTSPVKSFEPNGYGLYDIIGNVWEWCSDWYRPDTYEKEKAQGEVINPPGPKDSYDPEEPYATKKVVRGGSFLCNENYCASYRPSARMKTDPWSGENHTGFRAVMTEQQRQALLKEKKELVAKK